MFIVSGMPDYLAAAYRGGAPDAYGFTPEPRISGSGGEPCRHCLGTIEKGENYLVFAYRPFPAPQPYAETGPVFIHAETCAGYTSTDIVPQREQKSTSHSILRGYGADDRIIYDTGIVISAADIESAVKGIFQRVEVAYIHMRSATNNCFTMRIDRGRPMPEETPVN